MLATSRRGERFSRRSLRDLCRYPFEIDEDEILAGEKRLAEMKIAVNPALHGGKPAAGNFLLTGDKLFFGGQNQGRPGAVHRPADARGFPSVPGNFAA